MSGTHEVGVMSTADRLVYMANQIARNLAAEGDERATDMVAEHIRSFWDPAMRRNIIKLARECPEALSPIAFAAVGRIDAS
jgi:formate dehydrogenase subunit delta